MTLNLEELAEAKRLPVNMLNGLGVRDCPEGVAIEYRLMDNTPKCRQRIRTAMRSGDGFRWAAGEAEIVPYGLWLLDIAKMRRELILVEGESDCWTLWRHGFSAIGLPGSSTAKLIKPEYLSRIEKLYLWREPDKGGDAMVSGMARRFHEIGWKGKALQIVCEEFKDPSAMHLAREREFAKMMRYLMMAAKLVTPYTPPTPKVRPVKDGLLNADKVERAKAYPLWRLLEKKPGDKVLCIFHNDQRNPSMHLFDDGGGFCFTCQTQADSIDWLRKSQGMTFVQAVEALQK